MAGIQSETKKRRFQNACDECRKRKVRCDSAVALGRCTNCLSLNLECTHDFQRRKRGPMRSKKGDTARALVNAILSTATPHTVPEDPEEVSEILHTLANHARALDRQLSFALGSSSIGNSVEHSSSLGSSPEAKAEEGAEPKDSIDSLTLDLKKIALGDEKRHFGKSSHLVLLQNVMDAQQDRPGNLSSLYGALSRVRRPEYWQPLPWPNDAHKLQETWHFDFPEEDLLQEVVRDYFMHFNITYPILHRPTFESAVAQNLHRKDKSFGALLLAVCALGSRYSSDPRHLTEPEGTSEYNRGWKYFRQISLTQDAFHDPPSLYDLQLRSISVFYLQAMHTPEVSWIIIGIGIRLAQEVGAHRKSMSKDNLVENELWKRAFWGLIFFDIIISTILGRPRATSSDDFDLELPIECDDEFWEHPDPTKAFVQPEGKPSTVTFFVSILRLLDIIAFAHRFLYPIRKSELWSAVDTSGESWDQSMIMKLDSALNKFKDTIPDHLKWPSENQDMVFYQQSALLNSTYHWVRIQVHRYFLHTPGRQDAVLPYPSLDFCNNAARAALNTIEVLRAKMEPGMLSIEKTPIILGPLFIGVILSLVNVRQSRKEHNGASRREAQDMTYVRRFMTLIKDYEPKFQVAGRIIDIMNALMAIGDAEVPRTGYKRSRSPFEDTEISPPLAHRPWDIFQSAHSVDGGVPFTSTSQDFDSHAQPFLTAQDPSFGLKPFPNELTEEDWDMFMSSIDGLLSGSGKYASF